MNLTSTNYVFDSSTLIYLGKVGLLDKLSLIDGIKIIPREVYNEVVNKGGDKNEPEINYIINLIERRIFTVKDVDRLTVIANNLSKADAEVLSLAKETKSIAIIDERYANSVAETHNIETHGLIYLILLLIKKGIISKNEAIKHIEEIIKQGFYLSTIKYKETINKIREL